MHYVLIIDYYRPGFYIQLTFVFDFNLPPSGGGLYTFYWDLIRGAVLLGQVTHNFLIQVILEGVVFEQGYLDPLVMKLNKDVFDVLY